MKHKDVDELNKTVDLITESLLSTMLDFTVKVNVVPTRKDEVEYYMPTKDKPIIKVDILSLLTYSKKYGSIKAKAIIKPIISELIHSNYSVDAIGYLTNSFGKVYLYAFKAVSRQELNARVYTVLACNSRHSVVA
jgi:hypothetical protein